MTTAFKQISDNAAGLLAAGIDDNDTSLFLETGQGASFPSVFPFWVTVFTTDPGLGCEVIEISGRSGDTLNASARGQQGTTPAAWAEGAKVRLSVTAAHLTDLHTAVNTLEAGLDLGQTPADIGTFSATKTITITVGGADYRIAVEPVV